MAKKKDVRRKAPGWVRDVFGIKDLESRERQIHKQVEPKPKDRPDSYVLDPKKRKPKK